MKLKKLLLIGLFASSLALTSCDLSDLLSLFTGDDTEEETGEDDLNLYKLTLTSNLTLTDTQKAQLKATYAYGVEPTLTVTEGVRDEDDVNYLLSKGMKQSDIDKLGVRQDDGTYYFLDQDVMFLSYPEIEGYTCKFINKTKNNDEFNPNPQMTGPINNQVLALPRWNMDNKDTTLEAHYTPIEYDITYKFTLFNTGADIPTSQVTFNSSLTHYVASDGTVSLGTPTTSFGQEAIFDHWEYHTFTDEGFRTVTELPKDYLNDGLTMFGIFKDKGYTVSFSIEGGDSVGTISLYENEAGYFKQYNNKISDYEYVIRNYSNGHQTLTFECELTAQSGYLNKVRIKSINGDDQPFAGWTWLDESRPSITVDKDMAIVFEFQAE